MSKNIRLSVLFCTTMAIVSTNQVVRALGTHAWNDPAGGIYGLFSNWTPSGPPSLLDIARFALSDQYTVSFNQARQADLLQVPFGEVTFLGTGILPALHRC